ncbi:MAG: OadG family protein [Clostridia bacterium]|nr:OadG family protein [Clostridia bacterium]
MTITLEEAEAFSNLTVFGFGLGLVFIGLICIILICMVMGAICKKFIKEDTPKAAAAPAPVSAPAKKAVIANKGEFIAAVSAAIAEDIGTDVSGIRVLSVKQL